MEIKENKKKKNLRIFLYVLISLILLLLISIIYMQFSTFNIEAVDYKQEKAFFGDGLSLKESLVEVKKTSVSYRVPASVINEELSRILDKQDNKTIDSFAFDVKDQELKVNYKRGGLYFPILYKIEKTNKGKVHYKLRPRSIGKFKIKLPQFFIEKIFFKLGGLKPLEDIYSSDIREEVLSSGLELLDIYNQQTDIIVVVGPKKDLVNEYISKLVDKNYREIYDMYVKGESNQKLVLDLLTRGNDDVYLWIVEAYFSEDKKLEDLLVLFEEDDLEEIYKTYSFLEKNYELDQVKSKRSKLMAQEVKEVGTIILDLANKMINESGSNLINQGYPYLKNKKQTLTFDKFLEEVDLKKPNKFFESMNFFYDKQAQDLKLTCVLSDKDCLVMGTDTFEIIDLTNYKAKYDIKPPAEGNYTDDLETWQQVEKQLKDLLNTERVFIRYLKDDGRQAFAVCSTIEKPQILQIVALEKKEKKWQATEANFANLESLNDLNPDFNLNLANPEFEDIELVNIDSASMANIRAELIDQKIMEDENKLIYYSYAKNAYISLKLDNEKEYVITVYHQYLNKIYDKATAIDYYPYIPELILLQEPPKVQPKKANLDKKPQENLTLGEA